MTKRSILSIILSLVLIFSAAFAITASAVSLGDVDGDGTIKASDARLALRASVGLETLTEIQTKTADADGDGVIKAADARLILRASVGLEALEGEISEKPEEVIKTFNGHKVNNDCIGIETGIICTDPECCGETLVPSFNELVNALKTPGSRNYFYGFTKTTTKTAEPTVKATSMLYSALASTIKSLLADSVAAGTVVEYSDFTNNRHVNNATYFVTGKEYVSNLKEEDIKSITMEKMDGVDFLKELPTTYTSTVSGSIYGLASFKNASVGEVYKVTVTLNPEKITNTVMPEGTTPIEKIISADYNKGLVDNMNALNSSFDEMPEMAELIKMDMELVTSATVTYYFTADTFEPVAAKYDVDMSTSSLMHTYFNNLLQSTSSPTTTLTIKSDSTQESYYFFNDFFAVQ